MSRNPKASRDQIKASDPRASVWVNANAGSGKTHVLVDRVVRLMLGGTEPSRIMCLTFTKAAAAEMKNRLFERLGAWVTLDDKVLAQRLAEMGSPGADAKTLERARQLFTRSLETPGGLKIQTIHAFCERVLQLFPVEADVVPNFTMLDGRQSADLLTRARNEILRDATSQSASDLGVALADVAGRTNADSFDELMTQLLAKRSPLRDSLATADGLEISETAICRNLQIAGGVTPQSIAATLSASKDDYLRLAAALDTGSDTERKRAAVIHRICSASLLTLRDFEAILLTGEGEPRKTVANKPVLARHPGLEDFIKAEQQRLVDGLAQLADLEILSASRSMLKLGRAIVQRFEALKRAQGCYDFEDLIIRTAELLDSRPDAAWVLYKLDGGIDHLLVDEAQDTSPAQWQIVRNLTAEFFAGEGARGSKTRTIFVVGDRKQSIYSFQGADPDVFEQVYGEVRDQVRAAGQPFEPVDFTVSFRSAPEILHVVDKVFASGQIARRGLDGIMPRDWDHQSNRRDANGLVEIWDLEKPLDTEDGDPWTAPVDREPAQSPRRRLAKKLARTIKGWIGRRRLSSHDRAVEAGDILILVKKRNAFFDAMIRALWNEQVPVAGADRLKLGDSIAVLDLMALAQFALMPEDDHALACVLKSPIPAAPFSEEQLLALATGRGTATLWRALRQSTEDSCRAVAALLAPLVAEGPAARPFEFFSGVLSSARLRFAGRLGSEANDAIDALLDRALDYEEQNGTSLAGFVNWFMSGETEIKREMQAGANEVRIMTVHGAKGLEAPIVILPDTASSPNDSKTDPLLLVESGNGASRVPLWPAPHVKPSPRLRALKDAEKERMSFEQQRLLYVALTRPRDELYVCGYEGKRTVSDDSWYKVISNALEKDMRRVGDGVLRLGAEPALMEAEAPQPPAAVSVPAWLRSSLADSPAAEPPLPASRPQRSAARVARGVFIHRVLQRLPDLPKEGWAEHIATAVTRSAFGAGLAAELAALVAHPLMAELLSGDGLSEVPLITRTAEGTPERRRIDRLIFSETGILVADYKTDRTVPDRAEDCRPDYLAQMAAYRAALRLIHPGTPIRLALLWTERPAVMLLPDSLLDRMAASRPSRP